MPSPAAASSAIGTKPALRLLMGLAASAILAWAASVKLEGPGLEYDELHQAAASFAWVGEPSRLFNATSIGGYPLLNMPYSGAIKTTLYGLWMRLFDQPFSVASWRWLGILLGAPGLVFLAGLAGRRLRPLALALLLLVTLSDLNLFHCLRHDRGPVAIAFLLRCLFLGIWLGHPPRSATPRTTFWLSLIVGFAIFEKLSSAVLLIPFFLHLGFETPHRFAHWRAGFLGGVIGGSPLLLANLVSVIKGRGLVSIASIQGENQQSFGGALEFASEYLSVGQGHWARHAMMGIPRTGPWGWIETGLILGLAVLLIAQLAARSPEARRGGWLALSWLLIGLGLFSLPERSVEHHWILGTPFLIAGAAQALTHRHSWSTILLALVLALPFVRIPAALEAAQGVWQGKTSPRWSPSLTRLGELAAAAPESTVFLATEWGLATQIHCFNQGRTGRVYEAFWTHRPLDLSKVLLGKEEFYLVGSRGIDHIPAAQKAKSREQLQSVAGFERAPLEAEYAALTDLEIEKFVRMP